MEATCTLECGVRGGGGRGDNGLADPDTSRDDEIDRFAAEHANDIPIVMAQTRCSRDDAINALRNHDGDIVNAIFSDLIA